MDDRPRRVNDYNIKIIEEFRANQGRVGGHWEGITIILLHHIGAKSGIERVTPLAFSAQPADRFAIWAANGGSPIHPNWYHNLRAHPRVTVEAGPEMFTVLAQEPDGTARARLWPKLIAQYPDTLKPALSWRPGIYGQALRSRASSRRTCDGGRRRTGRKA